MLQTGCRIDFFSVLFRYNELPRNDVSKLALLCFLTRAIVANTPVS
ncbi:Uncharacterised protein [BD1-7 clade bacterium]|uniref:Uncharacterized protein n=1 Tax=BD1-7 clade bacterium TaxID=2029982 RepID=A0A5S9R223_9GAMM|nr:Uncharacterised protein [BD1-7 clade bacterium]